MTFHWAANHGAILQAYALQKYLSISIPDAKVYIINYYPKHFEPSFFRAIYTKNIKVAWKRVTELKKEKLLKPFREKLLLTKRFYTTEQLYNEASDFDVLITGSDQIWNKYFTLQGEGKPTLAYYLPFSPGAKRISYAASFGYVAKNKRIEEFIKPALSRFDAFGVRENIGKALLEQMGFEGTVVCDPTALLKVDDYSSLASQKKTKPFVAKYILRIQNEKTRQLIDNVADAMSEKGSIVNIELSSMEDWLRQIRDAKFLITNSFHGTMLAIKFHTPFAIILQDGNLSEMNDRFDTLLSVLGMKDRIIKNEDYESTLNKEINWAQADKKMEDYVRMSKNFLNEECKKTDAVELASVDSCTGCSACTAVCSNEAIKMLPDLHGFITPVIDRNKCIECKVCRKVCPVINKKRGNSVVASYACINSDESVREDSSSGGVFYLLAESIIKSGGVVFGAAFDEEFDVKHILVDNMDDLSRLCGSKYVQSITGDTFKQAKICLSQGKKVLFSGTSCQISGLVSYLGKSYDNLVTVDFACHGVPSPKVWHHYVKYKESISRSKIREIKFRHKTPGWKRYSLLFKLEDGTQHTELNSDNLYMKVFLNNLSLRESCYDCQFKGTERHSDITLADFWGIEKVRPDMDDDNGTSFVVLNSDKGQALFKGMKEKMVCEAVKTDEAIKYNPAFTKSSAKHRNYDLFFDMYERAGFNKSVQKCLGESTLKKFIKKGKRCVKQLPKIYI